MIERVTVDVDDVWFVMGESEKENGTFSWYDVWYVMGESEGDVWFAMGEGGSGKDHGTLLGCRRGTRSS